MSRKYYSHKKDAKKKRDKMKREKEKARERLIAKNVVKVEEPGPRIIGQGGKAKKGELVSGEDFDSLLLILSTFPRGKVLPKDSKKKYLTGEQVRQAMYDSDHRYSRATNLVYMFEHFGTEYDNLAILEILEGFRYSSRMQVLIATNGDYHHTSNPMKRRRNQYGSKII